MKTLLTSVLAMATFAIMMTSATAAYGQATPDVHAVDPLPAFGDPNDLFAMRSLSTIDNTVGAGVDIYLARQFVLYDPDVGSAIPANPTTCQAFAPPAGDRLWELQDTATGTAIAASHDEISTAGSTIFFDQTAALGISGAAGDGFGNGAVAASLDSAGAVTFYNQNANPALNNWVEFNAAGNPVAGPVFDSTAQPGQYIFVVCGWVDVNGDGVWGGAGSEPISIEQRGFLINAIVGGEMMPISTTSLLLAGASVNAFWILPILGLAGTIIAIRKLEA